MDLQLAGKHALVTGSNTGIGQGIANVLAREGVIVMVHGRKAAPTEQAAEQIRAAGGTAYVAIGDLATDEGAAAVVKAVQDQAGGIDLLINNVGGTTSSQDGALGFFDIKPEYWVDAMQQNFISAVRMIHAFVPAMRDNGWGRVINIASGGATTPPGSVPDYCAAKAALLNLTVSLSKTLARSGVTVNAISPGCTRTNMFEANLEKTAQANGWPDDMDERESLFMDLGYFPCVSTRYGRPDDIGTLVAFLASPQATFVNGANYRIDGGQCQSVN